MCFYVLRTWQHGEHHQQHEEIISDTVFAVALIRIISFSEMPLLLRAHHIHSLFTLSKASSKSMKSRFRKPKLCALIQNNLERFHVENAARFGAKTSLHSVDQTLQKNACLKCPEKAARHRLIATELPHICFLINIGDTALHVKPTRADNFKFSVNRELGNRFY